MRGHRRKDLLLGLVLGGSDPDLHHLGGSVAHGLYQVLDCVCGAEHEPDAALAPQHLQVVGGTAKTLASYSLKTSHQK